jgi:hypothetical protein
MATQKDHKESPWAIITAFAADLVELNKVREHLGQNAFVARTFVRTLFSIFDGYSWYLKQRALEGAPYRNVQFTPSELEMIREERRKTAQDGTVTVVPKIVQTKENLLFSIRSYARVRGTDAPLVNGVLPPEFHIAAEVRNRITHPKAAADFELSAAEMRGVGNLIVWFGQLAKWAAAEEQKTIEEFKERGRQRTQDAIARYQADGNGEK